MRWKSFCVLMYASFFDETCHLNLFTLYGGGAEVWRTDGVGRFLMRVFFFSHGRTAM